MSFIRIKDKIINTTEIRSLELSGIMIYIFLTAGGGSRIDVKFEKDSDAESAFEKASKDLIKK